MLTEKTIKFTLDDCERASISRSLSVLGEVYDNMDSEDNVVINHEVYDRDFVENTKLLLSELWAIGRDPFFITRD